MCHSLCLLYREKVPPGKPDATSLTNAEREYYGSYFCTKDMALYEVYRDKKTGDIDYAKPLPPAIAPIIVRFGDTQLSLIIQSNGFEVKERDGVWWEPQFSGSNRLLVREMESGNTSFELVSAPWGKIPDGSLMIKTERGYLLLTIEAHDTLPEDTIELSRWGYWIFNKS